MESLIPASYLYLLPDYIFKRNQKKLTVRLTSTCPTLIGVLRHSLLLYVCTFCKQNVFSCSF